MTAHNIMSINAGVPLLGLIVWVGYRFLEETDCIGALCRKFYQCRDAFVDGFRRGWKGTT